MSESMSRFSVTLYTTIDDVPAESWDALRDGPADLAMDRRLLKAFESTMADQCRCWYAIVRDGNACVATACLCRFSVDALDTTGPTVQSLTRHLRRLSPGFMRFGVLFCGLPVPSAASHLRIATGADVTAIVTAIDDTMQTLARKTRSRLLVWKELDAAGVLVFSVPLLSHGYLCGDVACAYELRGKFSDGDAYLNALRSRYRRQIHESSAAGERHGAVTELYTGTAAAEVFDTHLHTLYAAVRDHATYRMETLTREFFQAAARAFGEDASLVVMRVKGTIAGFLFGLTSGGEYHNLYVGLDYAHAKEAEVYFNLYTHDLDRAFRTGVTRIHLGQTSDDFKARLGAEGRPLSFFVRAVNPILHAGLRRFSKQLFPPVPKPIHHDAFRKDESQSPALSKKANTKAVSTAMS